MSADDAIPTEMQAMAMNVQSSPTDLLVAAIKAGNNATCQSMLVQFPQAVHGKDSQDGATPSHWAALFGNVELLEAFAEEGASFDAKVASSGMQPIHWASTHGRVDVVKFLLKHGCGINSTDIKQTTPLVIAAQYDHTVLVFFLVKEGADISLLDDCQDSALHWACYKGNLQTAALLHYLGLPADAADSYGSTPLHLAAARNAPHVIEYLIDESTSSVERLVGLKDNKGRTPLDIAKERGHPLAIRLLNGVTPSLRTRLVTLVNGQDGSRLLMYFYLGNVAFCYAYYFYAIAPYVGTPTQHNAFLLVSALMQACWLMIHNASPGEIDMTAKGHKAYEEALAGASAGSFGDQTAMPPLCHTCRIVKPLRSKHCSVAKKCVPMFDHFCPYIGNTIGGGNYVFFVSFIFTGLVDALLSVVGAAMYLLTVDKLAPLHWFYLVDMSCVLAMAILMNQYHLSLILRNLTTNEDMNKHRYAYLRDDLNKYRNPFSQGACGNVRECLGRRAAVLENPYVHSDLYKEVLKADGMEMGRLDSMEGGETARLNKRGHDHNHAGGGGGAHDCDDEDYQHGHHQHGHGHGHGHSHSHR